MGYPNDCCIFLQILLRAWKIGIIARPSVTSYFQYLRTDSRTQQDHVLEFKMSRVILTSTLISSGLGFRFPVDWIIIKRNFTWNYLGNPIFPDWWRTRWYISSVGHLMILKEDPNPCLVPWSLQYMFKAGAQNLSGVPGRINSEAGREVSEEKFHERFAWGTPRETAL